MKKELLSKKKLRLDDSGNSQVIHIAKNAKIKKFTVRKHILEIETEYD